MGQGRVKANGIELYYEDFGDPAHETVLLVNGGATQCIQWPPEFYEPIVGAGYHVVRFDNRDVGLSTWVDWETQRYTLDDMADDALGLLDALGVGRAHLVGISMGGMICQCFVLRHPARVRSLTSISSSPGAMDSSLPPFINDVSKHGMATPPEDRAGRIEHRMQLWRILTGSRMPFDEEGMRELTTREYDRAYNPNFVSHGLVVLQAPSRIEALRGVRTPTLVVHGTEDPLLRIEHGRAMADVIPGARMVELEGIGHEHFRGEVLEQVHVALLDHLRRASAAEGV